LRRLRYGPTRFFGDILKVTPTSKVVCDMNPADDDVTADQKSRFLDPANDFSFAGSVVAVVPGDIGRLRRLPQALQKDPEGRSP